MVGRYPHYLSLRDRGEKLISQKHISTDEVQKMVTKLETVWNELNDTWESRKQTFTQLYDLQVNNSNSFLHGFAIRYCDTDAQLLEKYVTSIYSTVLSHR
jgi:hypothetical protein